MSTRAKPKEAEIAQLDMSYLEGTIGYSIRRAQMRVFHDIYEAFGDRSLSLVEFSVMSVVADNPKITQGELAELLAVERPRMVPILDKLEEHGLAQRLHCADDKRTRRIVLTDLGKQTLKKLKQRFAEHEAQLDALLGTKKQDLLKLLQKLAAWPRISDDDPAP